MMRAEQKVWLAFLALAIFWGTSFLFIKIGLETLQPMTLVAIRLIIGFLGLLVVMRWQRVGFPRSGRLWFHLGVLALINVIIPFNLITWAEQVVDSGLTSVLNSTVPLFSVIISGVILQVEEVTPGRVGGLIIGFLGVVLLIGPNIRNSSGQLIPYLAIVLAAGCYAASSAYARRYFRGQQPVLVAAGQLLVAGIVVIVLAALLEDQSAQSFPLQTAFALLWLGLLGSCAAYIFYFFVLEQWGATRATLVTYLIPIVGVTAGALVLGEVVGWRLVVGGVMILSGVGVVNLRRRGQAAVVQTPGD
jgi:drug/metabolite transporter (DMT)-like permease